MVNLTKNKIILILCVVIAVCINLALYLWDPDHATFFMVFNTVADGAFVVLTYLPLLAFSYGFWATLLFVNLGALIPVLFWHFGVEKLWSKRKTKTQSTTTDKTVNYTRDPPPPEQQPTPTTTPTTGGT